MVVARLSAVPNTFRCRRFLLFKLSFPRTPGFFGVVCTANLQPTHSSSLISSSKTRNWTGNVLHNSKKYFWKIFTRLVAMIIDFTLKPLKFWTLVPSDPHYYTDSQEFENHRVGNYWTIVFRCMKRSSVDTCEFSKLLKRKTAVIKVMWETCCVSYNTIRNKCLHLLGQHTLTNGWTLIVVINFL